MAVKQGDRYRVTVRGTNYWYNPDTGRWFNRQNAKWNESIPPPPGAIEKAITLGIAPAGTKPPVSATEPPVTDVNQPSKGEPGEPAPGGVVPEPAEGETPAVERPPQPTDPLPEGWEWTWNGERWVPTEAGPTSGELQNRENLMSLFTGLLEQYGLNTPGLLDFVRTSVSNGWSQDRIMLEVRRHPEYLANPLFAANVQRAAAGGGWMSEGQVIAYSNEIKRLTAQYGYKPPSDNYIAEALRTGKSMAEFEAAITIQRNVEEYGPFVRHVFENELGIVMDDDDLWELFNPEIDTQERTNAYRNALYRGRPAVLGLGVRSQREADALRLLGVDPDEAFQRYQGVAQNATRFERLGAIESMVTQNLPANFGDFSSADNSILVRALVFQDPAALAELQAMTSREVARFNVGGGALTTQTGQQLGLLAPSQR